MGKKISEYWKEFLVIIISIIIIRMLFFQIHPQNNLFPRVSASAIKNKSVTIADYINYNTSEYQILPMIRTNTGLIAEYQEKYGVTEGNILVSKNDKPYTWEITWMKRTNLTFGARDRQIDDYKDFIGRLSLTFDLNGNLIGLERGYSDTSKIKTIQPAEAEQIAKDFSSKFLSYVNLSTLHLSENLSAGKNINPADSQAAAEEPKSAGSRIDYTFIADYRDVPANADKRISISITGDKVSSVKLLDSRVKFIPLGSRDEIHSLLNVVLIVAVIVLMIVLLFKRFRAFELGYKQGIKIGVLVALFVAAQLIFSMADEFSFVLIIGLIFGPLFYGAGVLIVWTISESLGREKWKNKFVSADLFLKGYFGNSRVGNSLLKGITFGFALNAIILIAYYLLSRVMHITIIDTTTEEISASSGAFRLIVNSVVATIFVFLVFVVFTTSYFKGKIKDNYLIAGGGIILGLINTGFVRPDLVDIIIQSLFGILLIWFFLKTDLLAGFFALASYHFIFNSQPMLFINAPVFAQSFVIIVILFAILFLWIVYALLTKDKALDFDSLTPAYVSRITERERLKRELEIAEEVQMSFLPREKPEIGGIEIAARCIPASEVGGDYYDYIEFDKNNLGIIVGDVSGKGIQASFYMTLVKGFLKAVAKQSSSPSEILNRMNLLFCENVEKGNFITMLLAKVVLNEKRIIIARAGHNPVIIKKSSQKGVMLVQPKGFALGMEPGEQFNRYIEEESIQLDKGDMVVFYTDGITEAMNLKKEEFGLERLNEVIVKCEGELPEIVIERILNNVKSFIGKAPQHDDITLVVIKMN